MRRKPPPYGEKYLAYRRWFRRHRALLRCEYCEGPASATHHILRPPELGHDDPHFWIVLCGACHAMTNICTQPFEKPRLWEAGCLLRCEWEAFGALTFREWARRREFPATRGADE